MQFATGIEIHEVATIFPEMNEAELAELADDIRENGLREAIWTKNGQLVDGRNRLKACEIAGVEPGFREWKGKGSLVGFVLSLNLHRRHLNASQRALIGVEVNKQLEIENAATISKKRSQARKQNPNNGKLIEPRTVDCTRDAAKAVNVSHNYISDAKKIAKKSPEIAEEIKKGTKTIPQAKKELGLAPQKPSGKSKVNGEIVDDPPYIAKARAAGKIAIGVVPEIEQPEETTAISDVKEEFEERAAISNDEMADESWLASLPLRPLLSGPQQVSFDCDALFYRHVETHRKTFAHHSSRISNKIPEKRRGPYYWKVISFLKVNHPSKWLLCPPMNDGGCAGSGVIPMFGMCNRCQGKGYRLK